MTYGSQQFFDELKERLNRDERFRSLGKDAYTATELIYIKDLRVGIWQNTADGEIRELKLIPRREIDQYLQRAELVYYVEDYDSMVKISLGEESFVSLVIQDAIVFKGPMKKLSKIQAPSERMETLLREMTKNVVVPSRIRYQKWLHENGYL